MSIDIPAKERLILALDVDTAEDAWDIVLDLDGSVDFYKVGWQLFIREGIDFVRGLIEKDKKVFLDLKMQDIEETIRSALANFPEAGIEFVTIHGNAATARAARNGRNGKLKPKLLMLTALSSWDSVDVKDFFAGSEATIDQYVFWKAEQSLEAGVDGLIASGDSVGMLRTSFADKDFLIVTPGVRPPGIPLDEHKRSLTPYQAIVYGADYLVVGRPIRNAEPRKEMAEAIIADIEKGLSERQRLMES